MVARNRLALTLSQDSTSQDAADALEEHGAHSFHGNPMDVWFRLGDIYERRLNDPEKAREAYEKVPADSPRYNDAQQSLKRR